MSIHITNGEIDDIQVSVDVRHESFKVALSTHGGINIFLSPSQAYLLCEGIYCALVEVGELEDIGAYSSVGPIYESIKTLQANPDPAIVASGKLRADERESEREAINKQFEAARRTLPKLFMSDGGSPL